MRAAVLAAFAAVIGGCAPAPAALQTQALPVTRFHQVDARLYRGAQPDERGFRYLRDLGVRTIVNLRSEQDAIETGEQRLVESLGMRYVHLPVKDGNFFTRSRTIPEDTVRTFFEIVDAPEAGPLFVHCRRGADRTGALVGFYRIARHGWTPDRAYAEARDLGMRSWYSGLRNQILSFSAGVHRAAVPMP